MNPAAAQKEYDIHNQHHRKLAAGLSLALLVVAITGAVTV